MCVSTCSGIEDEQVLEMRWRWLFVAVGDGEFVLLS